MGGGQGAAHDATPRPSVNTWAINTASATPTQQQRQPNAITVPGEQQACEGAEEPLAPQCQGYLLMRGQSSQPLQLLLSNSGNQSQSRHQGNNERVGEPWGHPRLTAEAICWHGGHRHSFCHSSSATAATERKCRARGTTSAGGGGQPAIYARTINVVVKNIKKAYLAMGAGQGGYVG